MIRIGIKLSIFTSMVVTFFYSTFPFYIMSWRHRYGARKWIARIMSLHTKAALKLLGINYSVKNLSKPNKIEPGTLIIANHLSYLDVFILSAFVPSCFVTSIEIKETPVLGQFCEAGGCLYVERRSRENLSKEISDITEALKAGLNVIVFPEATSTNGEEVKRFKRPLFKAAIDSGAGIVPITMNYRDIDNQPVNLENRDQLFWYGDMTFLPHFWGILALRNVRVELSIGESIEARKEHGPTELAQLVHQAISSFYEPVTNLL